MGYITICPFNTTFMLNTYSLGLAFIGPGRQLILAEIPIGSAIWEGCLFFFVQNPHRVGYLGGSYNRN